jgi:hypothetical protein
MCLRWKSETKAGKQVNKGSEEGGRQENTENTFGGLLSQLPKPPPATEGQIQRGNTTLAPPSSQEHRCLEVNSRTVCRGISRGLPEKKNSRGYHCVRLRPVFRLDLGVFPVDEQVEANEAKVLRRRNVPQAF